MKAKIALIAFLLLFLAVTFSVPVSFAARSLVISSDKTTLMGYEQMTITASASGFTNGETIYIKGAFYQDGSTNYFGYTKSGDNWIKNSNSTLNQRTVKIGDWDNSLVIESDFSDSGFKGEGNYKFKVGFYTSSNTSSVNWSSNNLDIYLNEPDPTLTNTPTPGPTEVPTLTPTPLPTPSKTPTPKPSVSPTPIKSLTPTKESQKDENLSSRVLGYRIRTIHQPKTNNKNR